MLTCSSAVLVQAEKCQVAQLTSAMIPQPVTAFALAPPAPDAERCGSANLVVCRTPVCPDYTMKQIYSSRSPMARGLLEGP